MSQPVLQDSYFYKGTLPAREDAVGIKSKCAHEAHGPCAPVGRILHYMSDPCLRREHQHVYQSIPIRTYR